MDENKDATLPNSLYDYRKLSENEISYFHNEMLKNKIAKDKLKGEIDNVKINLLFAKTLEKQREIQVDFRDANINSPDGAETQELTRRLMNIASSSETSTACKLFHILTLECLVLHAIRTKIPQC